MRDISSATQEKINNVPTNLALCWKITRKDGVVFAFTEATQDIAIHGMHYISSSGVRGTAIQENCNFSVDNFDIEGILDNDLIKSDEILQGLYDKALIEVYLVNVDYSKYAQQDIIFLKRGYIGNIKLIGDNKFIAEINGLLQIAEQHVTNRYSLNCRANFCDKRCGLDFNQFAYAGQITKAIDNKTFQDENSQKPNGYFDYGIVLFEHNGLIIENNVKFYINNTFELTMPSKFQLEIGINYYAIAGCDKSAKTCAEKFQNIVNFRGEPHIPGMEKIYKKN